MTVDIRRRTKVGTVYITLCFPRMSMKLIAPFALLALALLSACANPINRVTSDNYAETCSIAEDNGKLDVAEQACYRALVNVDLGNLGPELKSQRLYNLGRIKQRLSKYSEAELL